MANIQPDNEEDSSTIMLIQQYAGKFGITFSSRLMDDPQHKAQLVRLMWEAISGRRGAVTDADVLGQQDQVD